MSPLTIQWPYNLVNYRLVVFVEAYPVCMTHALSCTRQIPKLQVAFHQIPPVLCNLCYIEQCHVQQPVIGQF